MTSALRSSDVDIVVRAKRLPWLPVILSHENSSAIINSIPSLRNGAHTRSQADGDDGLDMSLAGATGLNAWIRCAQHPYSGADRLRAQSSTAAHADPVSLMYARRELFFILLVPGRGIEPPTY